MFITRTMVLTFMLIGIFSVALSSPSVSSESEPVDTVFTDPWDARLHSGGHVKRDLVVPLVEMDTSTYEKKFWLSEKRLVSSPSLKSREPSIASCGSSVLAASQVLLEGHNTVYGHFSGFIGEYWEPAELLHSPECYDPAVVAHDGSFCLSYAFAEVTDDWYTHAIWRRSLDATPNWVDSTAILTAVGSSEAILRPRLTVDQDTIFLISQYYDDGDRYFIIMKSTDEGSSWSLVGDTIGPGAGSDHQLLVADSVLVIVHQPGFSVMARVSVDEGVSWSAGTQLSSEDFDGQDPAASCSGGSVVHAVWYDFESGSSGWGGVPYYRRSVDCGVIWEPTQALTESYYCEELDIWADSQRVYAVWNDARAGSPDYAIYMRVSHDNGSTWSPEQMIVDQIDPAWGPDVYTDGNYFWFAWSEQHPPDWIWGVYVKYGAWYVPGDVDMSGGIDIQDLVYLVTYMFNGGPQPWVLGACEMDGNGVGPDIADLVYLVTYMFGGGPPPVGEP